MKLIQSTDVEHYEEIIIECDYFLFKSEYTYRRYKKNNTILRFKEPNSYYSLGMGEYITVKELFSIPVTK